MEGIITRHHLLHAWLQSCYASCVTLPYAFNMLGPAESPGAQRNEPYWWKTSDSRLPGVVYMRLAQGADSQWVCTGLFIDVADKPLTTSAIRGIPINHLLDDLVRQFGGAQDLVYNSLDTVDLEANGGFVIVSGNPHRLSTGRPRRGGRGPGKEDLENFAVLYRRALNTDRRSPVTAVAKQLGISVGTVRIWRDKCQKKGLLDPPAK